MKQIFNIAPSSRFDFAKHLQTALGLNYNKRDQIYKFLEMNGYAILHNKKIEDKASIIFRLSCIPFILILLLMLIFCPIRWILTGTTHYSCDEWGNSIFTRYFLKRFNYMFE